MRTPNILSSHGGFNSKRNQTCHPILFYTMSDNDYFTTNSSKLRPLTYCLYDLCTAALRKRNQTRHLILFYIMYGSDYIAPNSSRNCAPHILLIKSQHNDFTQTKLSAYRNNDQYGNFSTCYSSHYYCRNTRKLCILSRINYSDHSQRKLELRNRNLQSSRTIPYQNRIFTATYQNVRSDMKSRF